MAEYKYKVTIDGNSYMVNSDKELDSQQAYQYASQQIQPDNTDTIRAPMVEVGAKVPYSPTAETARAGAQGLTLGFADEIEAALRTGAISGQQYEALRDQLRTQQESFARENPKTALAAEVAGGLAMPFGMAGTAMKAPSILRSAVTGAGIGGLQGAGKSESSENLTSDVVGGTLLGGGLGGTLGAVGTAIAPKVQPSAMMLQKEGVPMTLGTAFGGQTQAVEQAAESLPIVGQLIKGARQQQFEAFNKAAFNRALKEIDPTIKVPTDLPLREAADFTYNQISNKYNTIYPNISLKYNKTLDKQLNALEKKHADLGDRTEQFTSTLNNIKSRVENKSLSGGQIKALKEDLRVLTDAYKGSVGSEKLLGNAYDDLENSIMLSVRNQNPKFAKELKQADTAYATYKRVENAAASAKGAEGVFTPAQLETAVKQGNKSQYARGKALLQDLSNSGYDVLGNKVPDSGTAQRLGVAGMLTGGASLLNPKMVLPTALGSSLYTEQGMKYLMPLLTGERPQAVQQAGNTLRKLSPYLPYGLLTPQEQ
jgi:hypothetical protein